MPYQPTAVRETRLMRRPMKRALGLGVLAAAGYAVWRAFERRKLPTGVGWQAQPFPYPPQPRLDGAPFATTSPWIDAAANGACPAHHVVKVKLSSGIYHVPGGANYERTQADRCYLSPEAAEADGMRAAKN
jgi:hypothetical protein